MLSLSLSQQLRQNGGVRALQRAAALELVVGACHQRRRERPSFQEKEHVEGVYDQDLAQEVKEKHVTR